MAEKTDHRKICNWRMDLIWRSAAGYKAEKCTNTECSLIFSTCKAVACMLK
jgi:hypothetical protein